MSPEEATIVQRARLQVENTIRNLKRCDALWYALPGVPVKRGHTAFIVGAGPSLDRNGFLLREAAKLGRVITVNTALGSVAKHGVAPECMILENVDVSAHVAHMPAEHVVAISANPNVFDAAIHGGGSWFMDCSPHVLSLARMMGIDSLPHGGAAVTAAVTYALWTGAGRIVLVGCDLAFKGGQAYASGSGWDGILVAADEERFSFEGRPDRDEMHKRCGVPPVARRPKVVEVPAWGGGRTRTKTDYLCQSEWLSDFAKRADVVCINATEGGARIEGWREMPLDEALDRTPGISVDVTTKTRVSGAQALSEVAAQVSRARTYCETLRASEPDMGALVRGFPMVEAMAAPDLIGIQRGQMEYQVRNRAIYAVLEAAADEVERVLYG